MSYRVRTVAAYCKQLRLLLNIINNPKSGTYQIIKAQAKIDRLNQEQSVALQVDELIEEMGTAQKEFLQTAYPAQLIEMTEESESVPFSDYWAGLE